MKIKNALLLPALAALALSSCSTNTPATAVDEATDAPQSITASDGGQLPSWIEGAFSAAAASLNSIEVQAPATGGEGQEGAQPEVPVDGDATEVPVAQEPVEEPEANSGDAAPDSEVPEYESDGGYVSHYEYDDAMAEGECPIGERNLDVDGLDCQPLSMSFDRYAEENGITFDEPEAEEPAYEDPESCGVLLYDVTVAGKRLEETVEGSAEFDAVLEEFLAARDIAEAAGC